MIGKKRMSGAAIRKVLRESAGGPWRVATYAYWRLRLASRFTETAFFSQLRALPVEQIAPPSAAGKRVLFFASRQDRDQVAVIATLRMALARRGHHTSVLGCDRAVRRSCNTGHFPGLNPWVCRACHLYANRAYQAGRLPVEWLSASIPPGAEARARQAVARLSPEEYRGFRYNGYDVGRIVRTSVAHFLRSDKIDQDPQSADVYREWMTTGAWLTEAAEVILDRHRPEVVVMLNGLFAPEWIMLEAARRRGIRIVTWEVGYGPETFFFQHGRPNNMCDNDYWPRFRDVPLTDAENERLNDYMAEREGGGGYLINYFPDLQDSVEDLCRQFGIDRSRRIALLFSNITWDSTVFERNTAFGGMAEWLEETIRYFSQRTDAQLVIRIHPAEKIISGASRDPVMALIRRTFPTLPANVVVVPPDSGASSYALMGLAECGLVYGSTTGLEMGARGIPVVVAGQIYYRGHGFTIDPSSPAEYLAALDDVLADRLPMPREVMKEAWRRYAYFAMFRSTLAIREVRYRHVGEPVELTYSHLEDLDPGHDPDLDIICDGIISGTPFLAPDHDHAQSVRR
jgi:hypothetical protein